MTSLTVPYSVACALPSLSVLDITNEVAREVADSGVGSGIAYVSAGQEPCLVRVSERESGFFEDLEELLGRLLPLDEPDRARLLCFLLGPRTEQIPFQDGQLCLGQWQRILLVAFDENCAGDWLTTIVG